MAHVTEKSVFKGCLQMWQCAEFQVASWLWFPLPGYAFLLVGFLDRLSPYGCKMATAAPGLIFSALRQADREKFLLSTVEHFWPELGHVLVLELLVAVTKRLGYADWLWPVELTLKLESRVSITHSHMRDWDEVIHQKNLELLFFLLLTRRLN